MAYRAACGLTRSTVMMCSIDSSLISAWRLQEVNFPTKQEFSKRNYSNKEHIITGSAVVIKHNIYNFIVAVLESMSPHSNRSPEAVRASWASYRYSGLLPHVQRANWRVCEGWRGGKYGEIWGKYFFPSLIADRTQIQDPAHVP